MNLWQLLLYQPLVNALIALYHWLGNLGWAIIALTLIIRLLLFPLTWPALKAAEKMRALAPKLRKLKKKYGQNKEKLVQAQMELYRQAGVKPWLSFLPQIAQIVVLIALFQAFRNVLGGNGSLTKLNQLLYPPFQLSAEEKIDLHFWYLDLSQPDLIRWQDQVILPGLFLLLAALTQFLSARLMLPLAQKQQRLASKTTTPTDDFISLMQTQSLYLFPLMTVLIGLSFPSGLVLYWFAFSLFNLGQQIIINAKFRRKKYG